MFQEWSNNSGVSISGEVLDDIYDVTQGYAGLVGLIGVKFASLPSSLLTQGITVTLWQQVHLDVIISLARENTSQFYKLRDLLVNSPTNVIDDKLLDKLVSFPRTTNIYVKLLGKFSLK
jgi:hypothetical protein